MSAGKVCRLLAGLLLTCVWAVGADWLAIRGDSRGTGWQPDEKLLTVRTVKSLRLLWKQSLGDAPGVLTDPLLLGPIVTHRGIKELVFVRSSAGTVYGIDADLGTIFWRRTLDGESKCGVSFAVRPAMAQTPNPPDRAAADDDNFSDGKKPLYVLAAGGTLHALRSSTGEDIGPPVAFLPDNAFAVGLAICDNVLFATSSSTCAGAPDRLWTMLTDTRSESQPLNAGSRFVARTSFDWQGKELIAELLPDGAVEFTEFKSDKIDYSGSSSHSGGLATSQDRAGVRWIYAATHDSLTAFQVRASENQAMLSAQWSTHGLTSPGSPVMAAGVVYFLSIVTGNGSSHLTLHAADALTGRELYTSGNLIASSSGSGNIAIANGHVCFSASDGILYCFGLPFSL